MALRTTATRRAILLTAVTLAISGDVLFAQRKDRYLELARQHRRQAAPLGWLRRPDAAFHRYHLDLARQYEHAAYRPWLSVTPVSPPNP